MAVNWVQNPLLGRQTPFYQPEEQYDTSGSSWMGGVGADTQTPQVDSIFAPAQPGAAVAGGAALLGGDTGGTPPAAEQMDYPSADAIERRRKLAEALMGKQMEVNHPMQAIANAVSQITGAYINYKADSDQKKYEQHRRDMFKQAIQGSGGDIDKMMERLGESADPEMVDRWLDWKMKSMLAGQNGMDAPTVKTIYRDGKMVSIQWDPRTRGWIELGSAPRWKGSSGGGYAGGILGDDEAGGDPGDAVPTAVPPSGAGKGLPGPGPRGRRAPQKGQNMLLKDGTVVATVYNPNDGKTYYQAQDGYHQVPYDARPTAVTTGGMQTPQQWLKLKQDRQNEINGLDALRKYFSTVKDVPTGVRRWAVDVGAKFRTFLGQTGLTPEQFNLMDAQAQSQALLGLFRTTIVGPGVMTEYDAVRVLQALGGNPSSALQNPEVMFRVLSNLYERKYAQYKVLDEEYRRNAPTYGDDPSAEPFVPPTIGGESGAGQQAPSGSSAPRPVLKPANQRQRGETTVVNGKTYVWTGAGWVPK